MCGYTISLRKALAEFFFWRKWLFSGKGKGKARAPPDFRQQREILLTHLGFRDKHIQTHSGRRHQKMLNHTHHTFILADVSFIIHGRSSQTNAKTMSNLPKVCHRYFSLRVRQSWQERNEKRLPLLGDWCLLWQGLPFSAIWPHAIMWCKLWLLVGQAYNGSVTEVFVQVCTVCCIAPFKFYLLFWWVLSDLNATSHNLQTSSALISIWIPTNYHKLWYVNKW